MTVELNEVNLDEYAARLIELGIWDGRPVDVKEAPEFERHVRQKMAQLLAQEDETFALRLASIGSLSGRDIQQLKLDEEGEVVQAGLGKSIKRIWRHHKKEILIGLGVTAVIAVVVVVVVCSAGTGAAAAAGGAAALKKLSDEDEPPLAISNRDKPKIEMAPAAAQPEPSYAISYQEHGIMIGDRYVPYSEILSSKTYNPPVTPLTNEFASSFSTNAPPPTPLNSSGSWFDKLLEAVGKEVAETFEAFPHPQSTYFRTEGVSDPSMGIGWINGIGNKREDAEHAAHYIGGFANNYSIDCFHNHSNGAAADLAEAFVLNNLGFSPVTANLLIDRLTEFHQTNENNPNVKYQLFCHSQGALHVRNALSLLPPEIRNRVIVVAIAPAVVISSELCYRSFNYASKRDIVPYQELVLRGALDTNEYSISPAFKMTQEHLNELIFLEPHPGAELLDHAFESPTFRKVIADHTDLHLECNGVY